MILKLLARRTLNLLYRHHWDVARFLQYEMFIYSLKGYISHFDPDITRKFIQLISTYVHNGIASKVPPKYNQDFSGQDLALLKNTMCSCPFSWLIQSTPYHWTLCYLLNLKFFANSWSCDFVVFFRPLIKKIKVKWQNPEQNSVEPWDTDQRAWYLLTYTCVWYP